jgi:hypothetical protein
MVSAQKRVAWVLSRDPENALQNLVAVDASCSSTEGSGEDGA